MKLVKRLANLGYGSRKEVTALIRAGRVTDGRGVALHAEDLVEHADVYVDDQPLDPPPGVLIMLNKPVGYTCSTRDHGALIYDLLPERFVLRSPIMAPVGRLDRDTSGLLLLTDDGPLLHRLTSPRHKVAKQYEVTLARDLRGDEAAIFSSGTLRLDGEREPCAPAMLQVLDARHAQVTLTEGRYHQVRRMFAALGNHVQALHRPQVGGLTLTDLPVGEWRVLGAADRSALLTGRD